ncbi:hypothetical protein [Ilumatobacter sp.]|uniref:hypothetical protein n=1 Tax=Ilumatobacter sp. TaxID=1967498 RepID=UPI003AF80985
MRYLDRTAKWMVGGLGVAVALSGLGVVSAGTTGPAPAFTAITPCRLMDTRPAFNVGPRATPLGENVEVDVQVHGSNGRCSIPTTATAIMANVIAVGPTAASFLSIWPADASNPGTSSLNYLAGQPPTPNTISVALSSSGAITLLNRFGSVDVVIDISGYFADHSHDDRYYTKAEIDDAISDVPALDAYTKSEADAAHDLKADASSVYTKTEVDAVANALDTAKADVADVYTKSEADAAHDLKADASSVYTKAEADAAHDLKADAADVYTKAEADAAHDLKADAADVYTKAETYDRTEVYNRTEIDALLPDTYVVQATSSCVTGGGCAAGSYTPPVASCTDVEDFATGGSATLTLSGGAIESFPSFPNPLSGSPTGWSTPSPAVANGSTITVYAICGTFN